jgi:hypothetical protein
VCIACNASQERAVVVVGVCGAALMLGALFLAWKKRVAKSDIPGWMKRLGFLRVLKQVDGGNMRVAWSNYQIVQSATWSIDVVFPSPFKEMMSVFSVFSFDFLSLECFFTNSNQFLSVYLWSATPLLLAVVLVVAHVTRLNRRSDVDALSWSSLANQILLLGYLVLPPVSLKQLQALDCVVIAGKSYLRIDTSIDCDSDAYAAFMLVDGLFITVYLSIPLVWMLLLYANRGRLNPSSVTGSDKKHALFLRDNDQGLFPLRFLFASYKPEFYFAEVIEM